MENFVNRLMILAKDCSFEDVTAIEYRKTELEKECRKRIQEKDVNLEGALEAVEILKRAKTDANCYETEKHQGTVAMANTIK